MNPTLNKKDVLKEKTEPFLKLNIAMSCDYLTDYISGSITSTLRLSEILHKNGHKIIFLAAKSRRSKNVNDYLGMPIYRFRSVLLPETEKGFRLALPSTSEITEILQKEKIDILHVILPTPLAIISMRAAKSLGIKVVIHSHAQPETISLNIPRYAGGTFINSFLGEYFSWLYKKADLLVYPTEFAKSIFDKQNETVRNVVISNGIDSSKFKKVEIDDLLNKWKLSKNTKNILFVGRLQPEKKVETLIKAIPLILEKDKNIHVYIIGQGVLKKELKELSSDLELDQYVTFFGRVSDEELVMAYNACDIFVLPSIAELEGIVVLEAMSCGKPIVIADSKKSASRFFVRENGFLFEPNNIDDLSRKIITLLEDKKLREKMGEKSLEIAKGYDIHKSVAMLEASYYSLF